MSITSSSNKLIALATGVAVAIALMGAAAVAPAQAAGLTQTQIQSIVSLLASFGADQGTINNVTAALNGQATTGTGTTSGGTAGACPALTRDLSQGSTGADVMALQVFLNSSATTQVSSSGAGSPGLESTYFGPATKAAVIKFQTANNVSPNAGYVGPITRAAIAAVCGHTSTGGTTTGGTTGGALSVSAGAQPQNSLAPQGAARVPFTTFTLSNSTNAPVTVNSVTVQRTGLGVDANFSGITLLDQNGLQIGTAQTLNSNHQANIGSTGFTIPANSSAMFTVAGNIATGQSTNGQIVSVEVVAVNTGASVSGALPITGASQTINSTLVLGSVSTSTSSFDPGGATSHNIGDTSVRFSGIKFTAGSAEDLKLYSIRWRQVGTAGSGDMSNVVTVVNGTSYPTTVDSTGKYYTSTFPGGILIPKGNSVDVYVQGDLTGSNNNLTVIFNIDKVTDVYFVGQLYGYGVTPSGNFQPWYSGFTTTILGGQLTTISKANSGLGAAQNVAINVTNQAMGGFTTNFSGEPVTVNGMTFTIATSSLSASASAATFTNISLVNSNGTVVAGPVDATMAASGETLTFTDTVTFPTGSQSYYLQGKVPSNVTGGSFAVSTTPSSWSNPTGQSTGNTISLAGSGTIQMNSMTVQPGTLLVSYASTPSTQNVVAGTSQLVLANLNLDASQSGENVRLASIPVNFTGNNADLSGCQLWNGAPNTGSPLNNQAVNTLSTSAKNVFQLQNSLTIPKGTILTLSLACNVSGSATNGHSYQFTLDNTTSDWAATGATSGQSITPTFASGNAGTMTIQTASLALTVDSSSPASTTVSGGSTGQTVGVYNLIGSNDTITLTKLGMTLNGAANASDVTTVWLYDSSNNLLGSATFGSGQTVATSTLSKPLALTPNTNTRITVKADVADVGTFKAGTEGDIIAVDPNSAQGNGSSGQINTTGTGTTAGVRLYNSYPTFTYSTSGNATLSNGVNTLLTLNVAADPLGDVGLYKLTFLMATSGVSVASPTFNGPNGAVSSSTNPLAFGNWTTTTNLLTVYFDSTSNTGDKTVSAGTTKTYTLQGTVSGITGTSGGTVSTALEADTSATAQITVGSTKTLPKQSGVTGNLIWSPLATTTLDVTTNDWTNGYALTKGCFASVGLAANCTANVVSK